MPRRLLVLAFALLLAPAAALADDSCQYANDNECDEAAYGGTGACEAGTDTTDCALLAAGTSDNSCEWANDGECDEPRFEGATGACRDGTDANDCSNSLTRADALQALLDLVPPKLRSKLGDDSCQYAFDLECDDANFGGTGACDAGTDASDCRALALGGDDSCQWASDGVCDEPGIGTENCADGSDATDCAPVAYLRGRDNTCATAFDGICNEPDGGNGACAALSDTADCTGRGRPAQAQDHFYGRDDRYLVDTSVLPFRAVGYLDLGGGSGCTGTLVGPSTVLTAAHCVTSDGTTVDAPLSFAAGLTQGKDYGRAAIAEVQVAPGYDPESAPPGGGNGDDWAILTLDRPLGDDVGWLDVHVLTEKEIEEAAQTGLVVDQAGYSWDTGLNLSGNRACRIGLVYADATFQDTCDTTYGDSGSPYLIQVGTEWQVVGVVSQFFDPESRNSAFVTGGLGVDSRAFAQAVRETVYR